VNQLYLGILLSCVELHSNFFLMIIQITNGENREKEWCMLEFQGEILGDLQGNDLGQLEIKEVQLTVF
jgi:hypothetical protein